MSHPFATRFEQYRPSGNKVDGKRIAVGIDIDGCVDPGMYKHETGFAVASIYHYKLQMITPLAMRAWMYVNCYSNDRGISRFVALCKWFDILRATPAVTRVIPNLPELPYLRRWSEVTKSLSPEALSEYIEKGDFSALIGPGESTDAAQAELRDVVEWSSRVNQLAKEASQNMSAFPNAVKVIRKLHEIGVDICAVSGTPEDHVIRHLEQHGILDCFRAVFAQQAGKKNLALTAIMAGRLGDGSGKPLLETEPAQYDLCAMFGDAPKDYEEARLSNRTLSGRQEDPLRMFLVEVGRENESWDYFYNSVLDKFVRGSWPREDELRLIQKGLKNLDRAWDPNIMPIDTFPVKG